MTLAEAILLVLLRLTTSHLDKDEPLAARTARFEHIANGVAAAVRIRPAGVDEVSWAAAILAQAKAESQLAAYVGEGRCSDGPPGARCDPHRKTGIAQARGYWQMWEVACREAWRQPVGTAEEVAAGALCASRRMTGGFAYCRNRGGPSSAPWQGAFIRGGHGASCIGPRGEARDTSRRSIERSLRKELARANAS